MSLHLGLEIYLELEKAGEIHLESEKVGERGLRLDLHYNCLSQSTRWPTVKSRQQLC